MVCLLNFEQRLFQFSCDFHLDFVLTYQVNAFLNKIVEEIKKSDEPNYMSFRSGILITITDSRNAGRVKF